MTRATHVYMYINYTQGFQPAKETLIQVLFQNVAAITKWFDTLTCIYNDDYYGGILVLKALR